MVGYLSYLYYLTLTDQDKVMAEEILVVQHRYWSRSPSPLDYGELEDGELFEPSKDSTQFQLKHEQLLGLEVGAATEKSQSPRVSSTQKINVKVNLAPVSKANAVSTTRR